MAARARLRAVRESRTYRPGTAHTPQSSLAKRDSPLGPGRNSRLLPAAGNQAIQRNLHASGPSSHRHERVPELGPGRSLAPHTRVDLERRLGTPLEPIRVHTDNTADAAARRLGALAFSAGRDIAFARGSYAPDTDEGRKLLVHELVHALRHRDTAKILRKCGPVGFPPRPDTCEFRETVPAGRRFYYDVNCDTPRAGQDGAIETFAKSIPAGSRAHVTGLASSEGEREYNRSLSCHRADDAAARLATAGAAIGDIRSAGPVGAPDDAANRAVVIEVEGFVPPPTPKPIEDVRMCGPAMDTPVDMTLGDVRARFAAFSPKQREDNCAQLVSFNLLNAGGFVNAWDIDEFFVPDSGWLDRFPVRPPCCSPLNAREVEDRTTCGRTIHMGDKCFLAGTVNYVLFGQISRLCFDEFPKGLSRLGGLVVITYDRTVTLNRVTAYKIMAMDDPGPPREWAAAGFDGYPANRGTTSNRPDCPVTCSYTHPSTILTWIWEPNRKR